MHERAVDVHARVALISSGRSSAKHDPGAVVGRVRDCHGRNARLQAVEHIACRFESHHDGRGVRRIGIAFVLRHLAAGAGQQRTTSRDAYQNDCYLPLRVHTPTRPQRAPYMLELNCGGVSEGLYTSIATTSSTEMK